MAPFPYPKVEHDVALCKQVIAERPVKPDDWEIVSSTLFVVFSTKENQVRLKGRSCREHLDLLIKLRIFLTLYQDPAQKRNTQN